MSRRKLEFGGAEIRYRAVGRRTRRLDHAAVTWLLHAIEHLTYRYSFGSLLQGVTGSSRVSRAVGPMLGGMLAGCGWWLVRRRTTLLSLSDTVARHERIPRLAMTLDAGLQVLLAGIGVTGGEILLACAAGAGLGAVYRVPVGGALFAVQHPLAHLTPTRGWYRADHLESRGGGRLARHP